jgi:hypothetical protein
MQSWRKIIKNERPTSGRRKERKVRKAATIRERKNLKEKEGEGVTERKREREGETEREREREGETET